MYYTAIKNVAHKGFKQNSGIKISNDGPEHTCVTALQNSKELRNICNSGTRIMSSCENLCHSSV